MQKWLKLTGVSRGLYRFLRDPKADWKPKAAVALGILYLVWPLDLVPDFIPLVGWLDDLGFEAAVIWYVAHALNAYGATQKK